METLVLDISLEPGQDSASEILIARLAALGFEGFIQEESKLQAYIRPEHFNAPAWHQLLKRQEIGAMVRDWAISYIPEQNWNISWESNYDPVEISEECWVRAPFHEARKDLAHDLVIAPKMSFGTAHHETTRLMMLEMLKSDLKGKQVLDLGCGTGILSILAEKLGAKKVLALDIDERAMVNAIENTQLNQCSRVTVEQGELAGMDPAPFDMILANINLNVLLDILPECAGRLEDDGHLILSGIYHKDLAVLQPLAASNLLILNYTRVLNDWMVAVYRKAE